MDETPTHRTGPIKVPVGSRPNGHPSSLKSTKRGNCDPGAAYGLRPSKSSMIHRWRAVAAAALACWPASALGQSVTFTPQTRVFVAYSVNIDYVQNLPFEVIRDQPRSPFFTLDSGLFGFEASLERGVRRHLGVKVSVSGYVDPIRGTASYCQAASCAVSLGREDDTSALFVTAGPVFTTRETKHTSWFAHALVGAVRSRSTFRLSGTDIQYIPMPVHQLPDTLILTNSAGFGQPSTLSESDRFSDIALAATLGGGFDKRIGRRVQFRMSVDWDPTFVSRPKFTTNTEGSVLPSERHVQDHLRLSLGVVWQF